MSSSISDQGGYAGSNKTLTLATNGGGELTYSFDMYTIPDRFIISYAGAVLLDTGFVSNTRTGTVAIPKGTSNQVQVVVATDNAGTAWNYTASVQSQWPTDPLHVTLLSGGSWSAPDSNGDVTYTGNVEISDDGGPQLLEVDNATVTIAQGEIDFSASAVAYALVGGVSGPLFSGAFSITDATGLVNGMTPSHPSFLAGLPLTVNQVQLAPDRLGLAYNLNLPLWLQPLQLASPIPIGLPSILLTTQGIQLGLPGYVGPFSLTGINFFGLFTADLTNLKVASDPAGSELTITGVLATAAPVKLLNISSLTFSFDGPGNGITVSQQNGIDFAGMLAAKVDWPIAPGFALDDVMLKLDTKAKTISGEATVKITFGKSGVVSMLGISLGFTTQPWLLNMVGITYSTTPGYLIPDTPFYLTSVGGEVDNISANATAAVDFTGTLGLNLGPANSVFNLLQLSVKGTYVYGESFSGTVTGNLGVFSGTTLAVVTGNASFDWDAGSFSASLGVSVLNGLFTGTEQFSGDTTGVAAYGTGSLAIPKTLSLFGISLPIPSWLGGGTTTSASFKLQYSYGAALGSDYLDIWWSQTVTLGHFFGAAVGTTQTVGLQITFDGKISLLNAGNVPTSGAVNAASESPTGKAVAVGSTSTAPAVPATSASPLYAVASGANLLVLTASYTNTSSSATLSLVEPGGVTVSASGFDAAGIYDVPSLDAPGQQAIAVQNPKAGNWQLMVGNPSAVGTITYAATIDASLMTLAVAAPVVKTGSWSYAWQATNVPTGGTITFFAATQASGFAGVPISAPLPAGTTGTFVWNGGLVLPASYSVFALLSAGGAAPVQSYAPGGPVTVNTVTDLVVTLTGPTAPVPANAPTITLDLRAINSGTATATGATADLTVPAGFVPRYGQSTLVSTGSTWQATLGNIVAGGTVDLPLVFYPPGTATSALATFDASVATTTFNAAPAASTTASLPVAITAAVAGYDLEPSHTGTGQVAKAGGSFNYVVRLANDGSGAATGYSLTETVAGGHVLSATVDKSSTDASAVVSADTLDDILTISGGSLAPAGSVAIDVTVQPFGATPVIGTAAVQYASGASLEPANTVQVDVLGAGSVQSTDPADLSLAITANTGAIKNGGTITFTVTLTNVGPNVASGCIVSVPLPAFLTEISSSTLQGAYDPSTGLWTVGALSNGISRTLSIVARGGVNGHQTVTAAIAASDQTDPAPANNTAGVAVAVACFAAGTHIATPGGERPVESLQPGMLVIDGSGAAATVEWVGHRRIRVGGHPRPWDVAPVRVRADAFGPGRPHRDLWLSPDHAVAFEGVLIPIRYLINGATIVQEQVGTVTYWHVELARHALILADGLLCESYLDTGNRTAFANGGSSVQLHPALGRGAWPVEGCAPLVMAGPRRHAARAHLLRRATALDHRVIRDADLRVVDAGRSLRPLQADRLWRFAIPRGAAHLTLLSRRWVPAWMRPADDDARSLGVAIGRLWLDGRELGPDAPERGRGWHAFEGDWQWTDGAAQLAVAGCRELRFELAMTGDYWHPAAGRGEARSA